MLASHDLTHAARASRDMDVWHLGAVLTLANGSASTTRLELIRSIDTLTLSTEHTLHWAALEPGGAER